MNAARTQPYALRVSLVCAAILLFGFSSPCAQAEVVTAEVVTLYGDNRPVSRIRNVNAYDGCYYYGRCTADDLRRLRDRLQRLDRVSPQPPRTETPDLAQRRSDVPPTPENQIRPEFREASQLRDEYREKATAGGEPRAESENRQR